MSQKLLAITGATCLLLTGCIDSDYDLKDMDKNIEVRVNDLTLPVNIDAVKLDNVFKLEDDSDIKIVDVNGQRYYALTQSGEFHSDPIHINAIHVEAPDVEPTNTHLDIPQVPAGRQRRAPGTVVDIPIPISDSNYTNFKYETNDVDKAVYGLKTIYTSRSNPTTLRIHATLEGVSVTGVTYSGIEFQLPRGLDVTNVTTGSYDPESGIWSVPGYTTQENPDLTISLSVDQIDVEKAGVEFNDKTHTMIFEGVLGLAKGNVQLDLSRISGTVPESVNLKVTYTFTDIDVAGVSGEIEYDVEGLDIDPISIGELPDFMKGEGTDIKVANPQLYLKLNNPVANDKVTYQAGFELTAIRNNGIPSQTFKPDATALNGGKIVVGYNHGNDGPYNFLLAPDLQSADAPAGFSENLQFIQFSDMSNLLSVPSQYKDMATLPDLIDVNMIDPGLPKQEVTAFPVGRDINPIRGEYELLAPLGFKEGTILVYEDTADGWGSSDLDDLTIEVLKLTATVDNAAPIGATVYVHPINRNGQEIEGLQVTPCVLKANGTGEPLEITVTGDIKDLDGVNIRAVMQSSSSQEPLSPDQTITLKDVRVTVSGKYNSKL